MAWALGELPMVIVLVALLVQWSRTDAREADGFERAESERAESDGETELAASA